jgi:formate-dependent phosphoribosylglycinamide formyltransferase (GAR transformylase)
MSENSNPRNERITKACQEIGYCCPYSFLIRNSGKGDTHKKVAEKVGLSHETIRFNRRKLASGEVVCLQQPLCQIPKVDR